jgi:enterochelin esterase-like enzyme
LFPDPAKAREKLKVLWISCGNKDGLMIFSLRTHTFLKEINVPHIWHVDDNGHDFEHWKNCCIGSLSSFSNRHGNSPVVRGDHGQGNQRKILVI